MLVRRILPPEIGSTKRGRWRSLRIAPKLKITDFGALDVDTWSIVLVQ